MEKETFEEQKKPLMKTVQIHIKGDTPLICDNWEDEIWKIKYWKVHTSKYKSMMAI